jgi:hypothetical protein
MRLVDPVHELVEWEIAVAYQHGYLAALADVAAGRAELDAMWRPVGRRGYERQVAERIAEMERYAGRLRRDLDRLEPDPGWPAVAVPGRSGSTAAVRRRAA